MTPTSDFASSLDAIPKRNDTMHGIGYLICKPPYQEMGDSHAIQLSSNESKRKSSLSRMTAQDSYYYSDLFGCSDFFK